MKYYEETIYDNEGILIIAENGIINVYDNGGNHYTLTDTEDNRREAIRDAENTIAIWNEER